MATPEVTVMGAGVFGLSIAYNCARRGALVRVIDPHGVAAGSSGGPVGALAPHTPENWNAKKQFQLESLLMAEAFWAGVETVSGTETGYRRLGRRQAIQDQRGLDLARARVETAKLHWAEHASWQVDVAEGWAPASATGYVVYETLSAQIMPLAACQALAAAIAALGGEIVPEGESRGAAVWATGVAGLHALSERFAKPMGNGVKGQAIVLAHDARGMPQLFAEGVHMVPHIDGSVAIGSTSERDFDDPVSTDPQLDALLEKARGLCPLLAGAPVLRRWAGVRPRAKTRAPMLGAWPGRDGHFIANGGFKIGFGMAPKVAEVMADLILEGRDTIPAGFRVTDNL